MAQLELSVVLNLANFRTQLGKLAQASAAYYYPVNLTIDKQAFRRQLAALGNIKPVIKINDSQLDAARARIGTLNKSLATLRRATSTPIVIETRYKATGDVPAARTQANKAVTTAVKGQGLVDTASYAELQKLYKFANAAGLQFEQLKRGAASSTADLRRVLGPAFRGIGSDVLAGIKSGLANADSQLAKVAQGMGSTLISKTKNVLGIKSPSRVFKEIGQDIIAGFEIGLEDFNSLRTKMVGKMRELVAVMRMEAAKIQDIPMAPGMSRSAGSRGSRQYMSPIGPLPEGSQEPWAFSQYRYQPFMAQPGQTRGAGVPPMRERFPFAAAPSIMGTTTSPSMFGASFPSLPSAGMTGGNAVRQAQLQSRMAAAYARSAAREASVLGESQMYARVSGQVPLGDTVPRLPAGNRGGALALRDSAGGGGGGGSFGGMQFNVPQLPGAGLVREIGEEFGFAAKQVLLFGTAYKALAFLQSFPGQVGDAVGALQSFRNTIGEISPSAKEAADSSQFILDIVDKYNTPLQSARDGFVKLYASMQPAGFSGDEIRDLFLGISQTAATFGMSADKVDRVNYAFAQMASKGQVMSEELKGQLGDVLPGAMAIFAEAAGFKGPEAITKFSKALEDGAYKGGAMKVLLTNVGSIMRQEFGPGAEGAARTFQGVMNRMQNSLTLLYETFEPVAVGFLNSVVLPMTSGLKTVTDGLNAFFTGAATKTSGGFAIAQELEKLRPTFDGLRANAVQLIPIFGQIAQVALGIGKVFLQIASNPFVGYVARVYLNIVVLTTAIQLLNLRALIPMIANFARSLYALVAFAVQCVSTGSVVQRLGMAVQVTGLMLRTFFATTGIGLVLVGIGLLTERFMSMNQALADTKSKALGAADAIRGMSQTEARQASQQYDRQAQSLKGLSKEIEEGKMKGKAWIEVTKEQAEALKSAGVTVSDVRGSLQVQPMRVGGAYQKVEGLAAEAKFRVRGVDYEDKQVEQRADIAPIPPGAGEDEAKKKKTSLESYYSLQDQLAKNFTQAEIDRLEAEHQHKIDLIKSEYDLKEARANSFQKEALKFERRMAEITLERQGALLKASNAVMAAQGSVAGGAVGGLSTTGATGLLQGSTGVSSGAHFDIRRADGSFISPEQARALLDPAVRRQVTTTSAYGPRRAPVPGASTFHRGVDLAGPANTPLNLAPGYSMVGQGEEGGLGYAASVRGPQGEMYKVGHLQRPTAGAGAARKVPSSEKRDIVADQKAQLEQLKQSVTARQAEAKAIKDAEVALADFVATATPAEEQKLQNDLLKRRTDLMMQGYSDSAVDQAMKFAEAEYKVNFALKLNEELERKGARTKAEAAAIAKQMTEGLTAYSSALEENTIRLRDNQLAQAMTVLKDRMAMAGAMTPDQELREQIRQKNPNFLPEQQEGLFQQEKLVQGAEKLKADMQGIAGAISDSFGEAFKGVVTGSMTAQEALAGFFQSVGNYFADMVAKMIAEWLKAQLIKGFMNIIGAIIPGFGAAAGGLSSGFSAGTSSAIDTGAAGWASSFATPLKFANGGIAPGGFAAFANGGIVTGPTLGLVGEGRYNEAVIPLPDGKSVPVDLGGAMGSQAVNNIVVNVDAQGSKVEGDAQESKQLGRVIAAAIQQELVKQKRPGGLLS